MAKQCGVTNQFWLVSGLKFSNRIVTWLITLIQWLISKSLIYAAHIQFFESLFQEPESNSGATDQSICDVNLTEEGANALLKFVYCSDMDDLKYAKAITAELLEFAHLRGMPVLEKLLKKVFLREKLDTWDVDVALRVFVVSLKLGADGETAELKKKAVQVIKS